MRDACKMIPSTNILIYDDNNLVYYEGRCTSLTIDGSCEVYRSLDDNEEHSLPPRDYNLQCSIGSLTEHDVITLDDTLMKRIAKYNKEVEIQKLDEIIKEKQEYIDSLNEVLYDRNKRVSKLRDYISKIWEINVDDDYDEDYFDE